MPNRALQYFTGDTETFRGAFEIEGVEQTPDTGTVKATILKDTSTTPVVSAQAGEIAGTQIRYKYASMTDGRYAIFLTAEYGNGAYKRTGKIEFVVRPKEAT